LSGLFYTLGRGLTYTLLAVIIYFGLSSFQISSIFQGWGDKALGPVMIIIGLIMLDVIKINLKNASPAFDKVKIWLSNKGYLGSVALGVLFALAFCPYSGVLFFGALMPMVLQTSSGIVLPAVFALGTSLPVIIFSFLIAYSLKALGKTFQAISKVEKYLRYGVASVFILVGLYYLQYLAIYLWR
jgi:cytochrome c biogenesis protein CcdA